MRRVGEHGGNLDVEVVHDFGAEWARFDQTELPEAELRQMFEAYFGVFPLETLPADAQGFDLGCGSGRWAQFVAPKVARLHCVEPSGEAIGVARRRLAAAGNVDFHQAGVDAIPLADGSMDFGYSLGVLHHVPDTAAGVAACVRKLKPGAPFLLYLYYALDNRPAWYRALWKTSELGRGTVSRLPTRAKHAVTDVIAGAVYWPLARTALLAEKAGLPAERFLLSDYRDKSFYTMRTDALDRFGTRLEQRFTRVEITAMMQAAGLSDIRFSDRQPYWVAVGRKAG